jgi:hypothetical protein
MPDWSTIASLATAGGTLVLALATFASVRSANRAARAAERSLLVGVRPVLAPSRFQDPVQKIMFADGHWVHAAGGCGVAEAADEALYFALSVRNVGAGLAVLHGWSYHPERTPGLPHADPADFRRLTRDIYIPSGDIGFWQGAIRDASDPQWHDARAAIAAPQPMTVDLLSGDHEGGQRAITRFALTPMEDRWLASVSRHWNVDRPDPR